MNQPKFLGPRKILGIYFSITVDRTPLHHALVALVLCVIHPVIPVIFYLSKELREGTGYERDGIEICVGGGDKCLHGFGVLDFIAPATVAILWWIYLPSFFDLLICA